ncbi:MAG: hypothetical protein EZS28_039262 [Streblomastix strix]|uniref:Uncharacterized protein n=1 Tax=Streblomastix strix TaxID=222440 RepID=A0A5J4U4X8_9EUKA|nr:MAG: hypothetical protein EZS28_039262 [Streblomastix strix]
MNWRRPSVMLGYLHNYMLQNEEGQACQKSPDNSQPKIIVFLGTYQIPGMVIISMVLVSVVRNKIAIQSSLVQTSSAAESIVLVPSQLRSIGLLAEQLSLDFLIIVQVSTHAMVELRVT